MARRRQVTNPLALAVLSTLAQGPMHPYQIARLLKYRAKDQSIKIRYGSLYTVMQNLEKQGYVAAQGTVRDGRRPERTVYALTQDGLVELEDRMREWLSEPVKEFPRFEAALSLLLVLPPDEVGDLLTERARALEVEIAKIQGVLSMAVESKLPRPFLLEVEYDLAMKRAESGWTRGLIQEIRDGTLDGVKQWRSWTETREFPPELSERDWAKADMSLVEGHEEEGIEEP